MSSRAAISAATLACAFTLAACGDDDAPIEDVTSETAATTTSGGVIAQDDFIASADIRCAEANAAIANLSDDSTAIEQEHDITEGLLGDLQAIGDAEDPAGSLADYYAALEDQIRILDQQATATSEGDTTTVASLEAELDAAKSEASTAAGEYGFEDCGGTGTTLSDDDETTTTEPGATTTEPVPVTPTPTTPTPPPVTPTPVDPGGTGGGTPVTPTPTPPSDSGGGGGSGGSGGIGPG